MAILVVDLEWTCGDSIPNEEQETIEIGAVMVSDDLDTFLAEFSTLIKPVRHEITELCQSVTNISNEMLEDAPSFAAAMLAFTSWFRLFGSDSFGSWGTSDRRLLKQNCQTSRVPYQFTAHTDLARLFTKKTGSRRGHRQAMKRLGLTPEGMHHRGLDDARNIARMLPILMVESE